MVKEKTNIKIILDCLVKYVNEVIHSDQAQIYLYDEFTNAQNCEVSCIGCESSRPGIAHPAEYAVVEHTTENVKKGYIIEDVPHYVNVTLGHGTVLNTVDDDKESTNSTTTKTTNFCNGLKSIAGIVYPILNTSGRIVGAIFASNYSYKQFKSEDLELLDSFCSELSSAVARISLRATLGVSLDDHRKTSESVSGLLNLYSTPERRQAELKHEEDNEEENEASKDASLKQMKSSNFRTASVGFQRSLIFVGSNDKDLIDWSFNPFLVDTHVLHCNFVRMLELTNLIDR